MTTVELSRQYLVFADRSVRRLLRSPEIVIATAGFPLILFLSLLAVFGSAVQDFEGTDSYAQRLVPTLIVSGLMFGSIGTAVGYFTDLNDGFMDRIRSLPVAASGPLAGAALSEAIRALVAVVVLVAVGYPFGFRFSGSIVEIVLFVLLGMLGAFTFVWLGLAFAGSADTQESFGPPLSALFLFLLFFSEGMVPL
ncbi:MAG: ABC transporter permease, partial [Actinomycetota bacterium]